MRHTNVEPSIQTQSPAANSRVNKSVPDANMPSGNLGVTGAALRDLLVNLGKNCKARKTKADPNNRRGATCERPDIQNLSAQIYGPHTSWICTFCSNGFNTLVGLTAHIYEKHQDGLFPRGCEPCDFQTGKPRPAREHQTGDHDMNTTATAKPTAAAPGLTVRNQTMKQHRPQSTMNRAPEIPELCGERKVTEARLCSDPTELSDNGSWSGDQDPFNPYCQMPCINHNLELSSSDGLEQTAPTAQQIVSLNFPPLNPQNQSRWHDNNNANLQPTACHQRHSARSPPSPHQ